MMLDDGHEWPTYYQVHGRFITPRGPTTWPVEVRCGLIAVNGDRDECVIGLGIFDEEPVVLTPEDVHRLREYLDDAADEYETTVQQREQKRTEAARHLLDSAVLTRDRWSTLISAVSSGDNDGALTALRDCAPQAWSGDIEQASKPASRAQGRSRRDTGRRGD